MIFSEKSIEDILSGRKTMTRRLVKEGEEFEYKIIDAKINSSKIINYYDNQKLVEGTFRITNNNHLTTAVGGTNLEYTITELTADSLTMTYLPRGNTLKYKKIN